MSPLAVLACNFENNPGPGLQVIYSNETKRPKSVNTLIYLKYIFALMKRVLNSKILWAPA